MILIYVSQLSDIKYTEEMCLKYVRGLKEIENFLRKSYGSLMSIFRWDILEEDQVKNKEKWRPKYVTMCVSRNH